MPPSRDAPRRTARPVGADRGPAAQTIPPGRPRALTGLRGRIGAAGGRGGETAPGERPTRPSGRRRARGPTSPSVRPAPTAPLSPPGRHCRLRSGAGRYAGDASSAVPPAFPPSSAPAPRDTNRARPARTDRPCARFRRRGTCRRTPHRQDRPFRLHRPSPSIDSIDRPKRSGWVDRPNPMSMRIFLAPLPPTRRTTPKTVAGQGFTGYHHPRDTPRDTRICQTPPASL